MTGFAAFAQQVNQKFAKQQKDIDRLLEMMAALCEKEGISAGTSPKNPRENSPRESDSALASPTKKKQRSPAVEEAATAAAAAADTTMGAVAAIGAITGATTFLQRLNNAQSVEEMMETDEDLAPPPGPTANQQ